MIYILPITLDMFDKFCHIAAVPLSSHHFDPLSSLKNPDLKNHATLNQN